MAWAHSKDGTRLHYEVHGPPGGPAVLAVQGLGADSRGWIRQKRALASSHRTVLFDNRGVGRSDRDSPVFDLEVMAEDALAVLDAAGVGSAHVVGASMGGVIAQVLGVRHPERVSSLVLACTACRHHPWRRELLREWADTAEQRGMRAVVDAASPWLMGPRSRLRFWPVLTLLGPMALQVSSEAFVAQIRAILSLDDVLRFELGSVRVPTLAVVGSQDILTPVGDSEEIVELVPDARLAVVGGAAHGFMVERAGAFNRILLDFLAEAGRSGATGSTASQEASQRPPIQGFGT